MTSTHPVQYYTASNEMQHFDNFEIKLPVKQLSEHEIPLTSSLISPYACMVSEV